MSKAQQLEESMRNRMNSSNQDAFETGEDPKLLAKLQALKASKSQTLALLSSNEIRVGALIWKPTGLLRDTERELTRADWEETGRLLKLLDSSMQWLIGDLIVCGEDMHYGDQITISEAFGLEYGTVRTYATVCRKVELSIRIDTLSFAHHQLVAPLSQEDQIRFLQSAAEGENGKPWSVARLRGEIEAYQGKQGEKDLPKYLLPLRALRKAYNPKIWKAMSNGEKRRVFSELKGMLLNMADELGETLEDES
jgi:hypothetical protein